MTTTYNFGDIYEMKKFMIEQVAPKYYEIEDINQYNVGLLGYTTEMVTVATEESFNALNTMFKELFISKATFPETIYARAGILGIDDISAKPAYVSAYLYIKKNDIISYGEFDGSVYDFTLDKNTVIEVGGIPYSLDYDIHVIARPDRDDFIITAQYDLSTENSLSTLSHQHIRVYRINVTGEEYVALALNVRQYVRVVHEENIITSNTINFPTISIEYTDMYAGMDVFYKAPNSDVYTPLTKRSLGSPPMKTPFVFYSHKDSNRIELSFTTRDNYFKPDFNSDIMVVIYTTQGEKGNFKEYTGDDITVIGNGETYEYNSAVIMFATVVGSSTQGKNIMSVEDLRNAVIERDSTSGAYNTETDLETYFNNATTGMENIFLKFIKRRDDLVERLFSCFGLFKDENGDYFHTNTAHLKLYESDFDRSYDNGNRFILNPGRTLRYSDGSSNTLEVHDGVSEEKFKFASPFLISMQKNPNSVTFYKNSVNSVHPLEYKHNEYTSMYQFIVNNISVSRDTVNGENAYTVTTTMKTTFDFTIDETTNNPSFIDDISVLLTVDEAGKETKAMIMELIDFDEESKSLTFQYKIETDDEINSNERITVNNVYDVATGKFGINTIPMLNLVLNVCIMGNDPDVKSTHPFTAIPGMSNMKLISRYGTDTERVTLVKSMKNMRSRVKFYQYVKETDPVDGTPIYDYYALLNLVPVVSEELAKNSDRLMAFLEEVDYVYNQLMSIMNLKTTNYSLDMKFYNTYGRSKNFVVGENQDSLDRTNVSMRIMVAFEYGTIKSNAVSEIQRYIKDYVENINKSKNQSIELRGYNGIYMSNLIQELENNFSYLKYMKFVSINEYDSMVQVVENKTVDVTTMSDLERREYVPEFLTISLDEITVEVL